MIQKNESLHSPSRLQTLFNRPQRLRDRAIDVSESRTLHVELGRRRLGGSMQTYYLLRELTKRGYAAALVCAAGSPLHEMCAAQGIEVFPLSFAGDIDLRLVPRLRRIIRRYQPHLIHIHSRKGADTLGTLAARLSTNAKVVVTRRVDDPLRPTLLTRLRFGPLCDRIIAVSQGIVNELVKGGIDRSKISQVYSAIQATDYQVTCDPAVVAQELGIPSGWRVVAVIAQLIERKGHRFLFTAAPQILARHPNTCFLILGEGRLEAELRNQVVELGIQEHVLFAGYRNDIGRVLNVVDLLVHPATMEGFANVALQAMAAGVPVVSSDVGGMPESVRHEITGILVPPCNPMALAEAVNRLLGDEALCRRLGAQGRHIVETEFTVTAMVENNLGVYRTLLG